MIRFNFELSDEDAENLFGCISHEINMCNDDIMRLISTDKDDLVEIKWHKKRIAYLKDLKLKLKNERV